ncbi:unnamed protein product [Rotaria sp. Silwood1]|nr:unnamed protein product [Rotaria sp. Silwood1]CAF1278676.1 unnamed protein product [Rotaria sp. Silwood1]CAF3524768.1 unnamed protein product [Rotaria sp. Silwood1]CAF3542358.1 unnamed protein product [Rotaria sp. Silwood1]CAF4724565.1 unnamed protein product [Rotaria sp. Silwood1]
MSSDSDTILVNLLIDEHSSISSSQSKTKTFSSEGSCYWGKALLIGLLVFAVISIVLVLLFFTIGKKLKKNKQSTTSDTITTTKTVELKDISSNPKYQPIPNV